MAEVDIRQVCSWLADGVFATAKRMMPDAERALVDTVAGGCGEGVLRRALVNLMHDVKDPEQAQALLREAVTNFQVASWKLYAEEKSKLDEAAAVAAEALGKATNGTAGKEV